MNAFDETSVHALLPQARSWTSGTRFWGWARTGWCGGTSGRGRAWCRRCLHRWWATPAARTTPATPTSPAWPPPVRLRLQPSCFSTRFSPPSTPPTYSTSQLPPAWWPPLEPHLQTRLQCPATALGGYRLGRASGCIRVGLHQQRHAQHFCRRDSTRACGMLPCQLRADLKFAAARRRSALVQKCHSADARWLVLQATDMWSWAQRTARSGCSAPRR